MVMLKVLLHFWQMDQLCIGEAFLALTKRPCQTFIVPSGLLHRTPVLLLPFWKMDQPLHGDTILLVAAFAAILANGSVVTWGGPEGGGDSRAVQDRLRNVQQI